MALVQGLNIGVGLLLLIILWIICVIVVVIFVLIQKPKWVGLVYDTLIYRVHVVSLSFIISSRITVPGVILSVVVSTTATLVLILYPRGDASYDSIDPVVAQEIDELFIARTLIMSLMVLTLVVGLVAIILLHSMQPMRAKAVGKLSTKSMLGMK